MDDRRATFKHYQDDDSEAHVEDSWKESLRHDTTGHPWTGRSVFCELGSYLQVYDNDVTELTSLKLFLLVGFTKNYGFNFYDVSTEPPRESTDPPRASAEPPRGSEQPPTMSRWEGRLSHTGGQQVSQGGRDPLGGCADSLGGSPDPLGGRSSPSRTESRSRRTSCRRR